MKKYNRLSDEKKCIICLILTIIFGIVMFCTYTADDANQHEGIIRLHVIANSNTASDQGIKLKVRDAIIKHMQSRDDISTRRDMEEYITANTDRLERIAEGVVASEGRDDNVKASLGIRYIPEKTYGGTTFPAGNYEALDIRSAKAKAKTGGVCFSRLSVCWMKAPAAPILPTAIRIWWKMVRPPIMIKRNLQRESRRTTP